MSMPLTPYVGWQGTPMKNWKFNSVLASDFQSILHKNELYIYIYISSENKNK